jgi:hypothetical protein
MTSKPTMKPKSGHHRAERQVRHDQLDEQRLLGGLRTRPDQQRRNHEGAGHQQTENDDRAGGVEQGTSPADPDSKAKDIPK